MTFTMHPVETTSWKKNPVGQYLKGFGGCAVPASPVKVYEAKTLKLIRIDPPTFYHEASRKGF